jgi:hypothetical protein
VLVLHTTQAALHGLDRAAVTAGLNAVG